MKKLKWLAALLLVSAMVFSGCSNGSDSKNDAEPMPSDPINIEPSSYNGKILRNKVVMLDNSKDVFYEYLEFTSETGGNYSLYKAGKSGNEKQDKFNDVNLPSKFSYDKSLGKITCNQTVSYFYEYTVDGEKKAGIAQEILSATDKSSLFTTWKSKDGISFKFTKNDNNKNDEEDSEVEVYNCNVSKSDVSIDYSFSIKEGAFTLGNVPFFWGKLNKNNTLYYLAYETEREEVDAVGRSASDASRIVDVEFGRFIFCELN